MEMKVVKRKTFQVVWLEPKVMAKVLELSDQYNIAPNQVISEIVKHALLGESMLTKKEIVEKKVKVVVCPFCLKEYVDVSSFEDHITKDHPEIYAIIKKKMVGAL